MCECVCKSECVCVCACVYVCECVCVFVFVFVCVSEREREKVGADVAPQLLEGCITEGYTSISCGHPVRSIQSCVGKCSKSC